MENGGQVNISNNNRDRYFSFIYRLARYASESHDLNLIMILMKNYKLLTDQQSFSKNTLRAYRKAIKDFLAYIGPREHLHLTPARSVHQFIESLETPRQSPPPASGRGRPPSVKPLARNSIIQRVSAIRFLFNVFVGTGMCRFNPVDGIRRGRSADSGGTNLPYYRDIELVELFAVADAHDKCLILLGAHGGLRASEMCGLRWESISFDEQLLHLDTVNSAVIHLSNRLMLNLRSWKQEVDSHGFLPEFVLTLRTQTGLYKRMKNLCRASGVEFRGVHALRNSCGRKLLRLTGDARTVQQHLRLRSIEQVQRFSIGEIPLATTVSGMDF